MPDGVDCSARSRQRELACRAGRLVQGIGCSGIAVRREGCQKYDIVPNGRWFDGNALRTVEMPHLQAAWAIRPEQASAAETSAAQPEGMILSLDQKSISVKSFTQDRLDSVYG
jgi:hypothetical protein